MYNDMYEKIMRAFDLNDDGFFYSVPAFPPCDVYIDDENKLVFDFALVGYRKEDLKIEFAENMLIISTVDNYKAPENVCKKNISRNIKRPAFKYTYGVPETKYDFDKANAEFKDSLLKIEIPPKEEQRTSKGLTIK